MSLMLGRLPYYQNDRRGALTSFGLCLLLLCLTPFLLDVATCDEILVSSLHHPVLVDGEELDPSKDATNPTSYDEQFLIHIFLAGICVIQEPPPDSATPGSACDVPISELTTRPPPVS